MRARRTPPTAADPTMATGPSEGVGEGERQRSRLTSGTLMDRPVHRSNPAHGLLIQIKVLLEQHARALTYGLQWLLGCDGRVECL